MNLSETARALFDEIDSPQGREGGKNGARWLETGEMSVRQVAYTMKDLQARFVTITAFELPGDEGIRLEYAWDREGKILIFPFHLAGKTVDSIYDICEAADWIEREVHEGFSIDFIGRDYEPLLLREGDRTGVNLREVSK